MIPICAFALCTVARAETVQNPDLGGLWTPHFIRGKAVDNSPIRWLSSPPYTAYGQALWDAYAAEFDPAMDDPARFCVHPGMPTSMIGTPTFPMEIFHRPQDITLTDPRIYAEPIRMRGVWRYSPETPIMEYVCSQNIYDEHIAEKRSRAAGGDGGEQIR